MATISHRKYIKWYPDEASEPTSTLVLTSPKNRFVDLRILLPANGGIQLSDEPTGLLPLEKLDWAIAGTVASTPITAPSGESIRRATFSHWISSREVDPSGVSDDGDMYPQPDGTTLEKGAMLNPDTGRITEYDELWDDVEPAKGEVAAVLMVDVGDVKGMVVWIGAFCQGLVRDEDGVTLERWERGGDGKWARTVRVGKREMPCESIVTGELKLEKDGVVACQSDVWKVVEL